MKNLLKIAIVSISMFVIVACGGSKSNYKPAPMLVPHQIHETLKVNVLDYKVVSDPTVIPNLKLPNENFKYFAVRIQATNPGEHRGKGTALFGRVVEKVYVNHPSFQKPIPLLIQGMFENLNEYSSGARGILFKELKPGDTITGWLVGFIPKDANPPYQLQFEPSKRVGKVLPIEVELTSF